MYSAFTQEITGTRYQTENERCSFAWKIHWSYYRFENHKNPHMGSGDTV